MGALGMGLGLAFGRKVGTAGNPPPPASVASPVSGTDLTAVWNLQYSGTGPRTSASNGTLMPVTPVPGTTTNMPAYLLARGASWSNYGDLFFDIGANNYTVSNYDFTNAPYILVNGTGTITFVDCVFRDVLTNGNGTSISAPTDINRNINTTPGSTLVLNFNYCSLRNTAWYGGSGTFNFTYSRFDYMISTLGDTSTASASYNNCYMPGIGTNPAAGAHVEACQFNSNSPATLVVNNCMIDCAAQGQATLGTKAPNYGWTAVWALVGTGAVTISNNIFIGITEVVANPSNPGRIAYDVTFNSATGVGNTLTNNVLQLANFGYVTGKTGATISGNRTFGNVALTAADFS